MKKKYEKNNNNNKKNGTPKTPTFERKVKIVFA